MFMNGPDFPFEPLQGFFASHVLLHAVRTGLLSRMVPGASCEELALEFQYDVTTLRSLLNFLRLATGVVVCDSSNRFHYNASCGPIDRLSFHIEKFVGAYGAIAEDLNYTLAARTSPHPNLTPSLAKAFRHLLNDGTEVISELFVQWNVGRLLELGCGLGSILIAMCERDSDFHGWGVDVDEGMCLAAMRRMDECGCSKRVRIIQGDATNAALLLSDSQRAEVDALYARSMVNSFFSNGTVNAVGFLAGLRAQWPGRLFFIQDYYGKLGSTAVDRAFTHTLLQDFVQVLTGQGVPPPTLNEWAEVYSAAGCDLLHAYEGTSDGIEGFIHVLRL